MNSRACAVVVLVALFAGCEAQPSPVDLYMKGESAAESGQLDLALLSLSQAIDKNPSLGLAFIARGDVYKQKGDYKKAAADFQKAAVLEPFNFNANYELGLMWQFLDRFADAVGSYQKAVEIRPLDPQANMNLAIVYTQMGEPLRGLPYAERAVQGAKDAATTNNIGVIYDRMGYTDMAIASLKRSIELNGRSPEIYLNLYQEYMKAGKTDQARNVLETAQELAPSPAVSERLGFTYFKSNDFNRAREAYHDALRQNPDYVQALNGLGVVALTQYRLSSPPNPDLRQEAMGYWDRSLKINPDQAAIKELVAKNVDR
jgi:tetratricopeptide (TPR) repeat protein